MSAKKVSPAQAFTVRDRVVHLLAIRQYRRPELLLRLMKDGLATEEQKQLDIVLEEVASGTRDTLHLKDDAWIMFRPDWSLYTDQDKELVAGVLSRRESFKSSFTRAAAAVSSAGEPKASSQSASKKRPRQQDAASTKDDAATTKRKCIQPHIICRLPKDFTYRGDDSFRERVKLNYPKIEREEQFLLYCQSFNAYFDAHLKHHHRLMNNYRWLEDCQETVMGAEYEQLKREVDEDNKLAESMHYLLSHLQKVIVQYDHHHRHHS